MADASTDIKVFMLAIPAWILYKIGAIVCGVYSVLLYENTHSNWIV